MASSRSLCSKPIGSQYIAINYGTIRTRVAVLKGKTVKVIQNSPLLVSFTKNNELIVGTLAKELAMTDPTRVYDIKRLLERRFDDPETQKEMKMLPYEVVKAPNGQVWFESNGRAHNPTEIVASTLIYSKQNAKGYLRKLVSNAMFTYPSEWNGVQIGALAHAGYMARLDYQGAIMAPLAAALSYDLIKTDGRIIVVVLFGGRTCDVSIQKVSNGEFIHIASGYD